MEKKIHSKHCIHVHCTNTLFEIKRPAQRMCVYVCVFEALASVLEEEM